MSALEREFMTRLIQLAPDLPEPEREYRFHHKRRFRFDFAYPDARLAIELEGGTWRNGRHTRPQGYASDCEKYNLAALDGWRVLRFTSDMLRDDPVTCIEQVRALFEEGE